MPGSRASPSMSGSSVVPGLPNMTETPSCLRIWRNACFPEMNGIAGDDRPLSCLIPGGSDRYARLMSPADFPLLRAARRQPTAFTPLWLMRQAGRFLPEYRAMRARFGFLELCKNPEAAAEVTLQPVDRLGVDAAILFADILLLVEPLGVGLEFARGEGPVIHRPVRSSADVARLQPVDVDAAVPFVFETVRTVVRALGGRVPLIGFAGAPFTVASYVVEGGASREYLHVKRLMYEEPEAWHRLMEILATATARYLNGQIAAGADAVQIFDSWVGALAPADYRTFVLPHVASLIKAITPGVPVIH